MFNDLMKIISIEWFQFLIYSRTLRLFDSPRCPTAQQDYKVIRDFSEMRFWSRGKEVGISMFHSAGKVICNFSSRFTGTS
ncbi:hypothetical protein CapIbe_007653 [Capra ibex]